MTLGFLVGLSILGLGTVNLSAQKGTALPGSVVAPFQGHLFVLDHGKPRDFDDSSLRDVKYLAFYCSATWCKSCRPLTAQLVVFYHYFKRSHPDFELIFISADPSQESMLADMKEEGMPWPAIRFADLHDATLNVSRYWGAGIPGLVLLDAQGRVLSETFHGHEYIDPENVIEDIKKMVPGPAGT